VIFALAASDVLIEETRRSIRKRSKQHQGHRAIDGNCDRQHAANAQSGPYNQALLSFLRHLGRVRANEIKMYDENDQLIYTSPPSTTNRQVGAGLVQPAGGS